jgi:hypothetical protein
MPSETEPERSGQGYPFREWARGFADPGWRVRPDGLEEQQIAARPEYAFQLGQDTRLHGVSIVVKHGDRGRDVECAGSIGNSVALEPAELCGWPPTPRNSQHRLDEIDAAVLAAPPLKERYPAARAAAVVEKPAATQREQPLESLKRSGQHAALDPVDAGVLDRVV